MGQTVAKGYGLVDLNVKFNQEKAISYSYEAELGTLDYALANPALADKVVAVADWHINSFESNLFEYGSAYTGDPSSRTTLQRLGPRPRHRRPQAKEASSKWRRHGRPAAGPVAARLAARR